MTSTTTSPPPSPDEEVSSVIAKALGSACFWIVQPINGATKIRPQGVSRINIDVVDDLIESVARGAIFDRQGGDFNHRLIDIIRGKEMATYLTSILPCDNASDLIAAKALEIAHRQRIPISMPIHFVCPPADTARAAEFDVQERLIYEVLHSWDRISIEDRRHLVSFVLRDTEFADMQEPLLFMCEVDSAALVSLIMVARGRAWEEKARLKPCPEKPRKIISCSRQVFGGWGCPCGHESVAVAVYKAAYKRNDHPEVERLLDSMPCGRIQQAVLTVLLGVWKGIRAVPVTKKMRQTFRTNAVRVMLDRHAHPLFAAVFGSADAALVHECHHDLMREFLIIAHLFSCAHHGGEEEGQSFPDIPVTVSIDSPGLRLFPRSDPVLTRWFDELKRALDCATGHKRATSDLMILLQSVCRGSQRVSTLPQRILYVAYDLIYWRHIAVEADLEDLGGVVPEPVPDEDPTWMTFGLQIKPSPGWAERNADSESLVEAVRQFRVDFQETVRRDIIMEIEAGEKKRARRGGSKHKNKNKGKTLPIPQMKPSEDEEEEEETENDDNHNSPGGGGYASEGEGAEKAMFKDAIEQDENTAPSPPRTPPVIYEDRPGGAESCALMNLNIYPFWSPVRYEPSDAGIGKMIQEEEFFDVDMLVPSGFMSWN